MGSRVCNDTTGHFTSTDPEPGGNVDAYTYPLDPTNSNDISGDRAIDRYDGGGSGAA